MSPVTTRMVRGSMPSSSAVTVASMASTVPWPISLTPENTVTRPDRSTLSWTALWGMSLG